MNNIIRHTVARTDRYNFHSHTQFCDGHATVADMARAAADARFDVWGVSPHAPISVDSPCNMTAADVAPYLDEVARARRANPGLTILAGMEVDYIDPDNGPASPDVADYGLDFVIGSVHFVPDRHGVPHDIDGAPERFARRVADVYDGDLDYVVRTFWAQTMAMIKQGGFDIIGHIDKIARNAVTLRPRLEQQPEYRRMADTAIDAAIACGAAIEINTKQRAVASRFFPHPRYWARIARAGVPMPVNSDAHATDTLDAGRREAICLLQAITALDTTPGATLAVVTANGATHTFNGRGVADLYRLYTCQPDILHGATVADKVVGRGAAALICMGGVSTVYSDVISEAALATFATHPDIAVDADIIVDAIQNRTKTGLCPVETLTKNTPDPAMCIPLIDDFMQKNL